MKIKNPILRFFAVLVALATFTTVVFLVGIVAFDFGETAIKIFGVVLFTAFVIWASSLFG